MRGQVTVFWVIRRILGSCHRAHSDKEVRICFPKMRGSGRQVGGTSYAYFWILSLIYPKGDFEQAVEFLGQELQGGSGL